ncbi:RNA methyltransferase, TrmH family [Lunatimonas lonarensis]|uniref:RNA methyltransferase, TrmH family n=1 Tax=Lunatimonas lonarensis TaxID=1232681 RepID=R7ZPG5_9BACT|nr:RNA methyltransferase [Lunatimonas lonarensis]EON75953.1 RNA methyltransferase, TrmH family [Lunatimonas lonarensis]
MLSKNTLKFIKSLHQKKIRKEHQSFFVEGAKNVTELIYSDFEITHLLFTAEYAEVNKEVLQLASGSHYEVSESVLADIGSFQTNRGALAVAKMKPSLSIEAEPGELLLALDDVRDPGNLGTIIRIADWYGIRKIWLSLQSADCYNPKVLHASMGSFTRVQMQYVDLAVKLKQQSLPVFGAFLDGQNIHGMQLRMEGILVMGNESNGISREVEALIGQRLRIPAFGNAESLNVAIATAVICDNFRRFEG